MTKRYLTENQISFEEINIDNEPEALGFLKDQRFPKCPSYFRRTASHHRFSSRSIESIGVNLKGCGRSVLLQVPIRYCSRLVQMNNRCVSQQ